MSLLSADESPVLVYPNHPPSQLPPYANLSPRILLDLYGCYPDDVRSIYNICNDEFITFEVI